MSEPAAPSPSAPEPEPTSQPTSQPSGHAMAEQPGDGYESSLPTAQADGSLLYGDALDEGLKSVPLATLLGGGQEHAGKTIRTAGKVDKVCKAMGCWIELSDGSGSLRVPMAGHAYFLPQNALGKQATIQGEVKVTPLTQAQKDHLTAEGATAVEASVSLSATGIVIAADG